LIATKLGFSCIYEFLRIDSNGLVVLSGKSLSNIQILTKIKLHAKIEIHPTSHRLPNSHKLFLAKFIPVITTTIN